MFDFLKGPRRKTLRETPLSTEQWKIVLDRVPLARKLDEAGRARLGGLMQIFLDEKNFEGGAGFVVTDEMKLVIAAEACLLLVHRDPAARGSAGSCRSSSTRRTSRAAPASS